jgi:hypothetical protein
MPIVTIAKRLGLSRTETTAAIDRGLPKVDGAFKRRQVAVAALRLDELQRCFTSVRSRNAIAKLLMSV